MSIEDFERCTPTEYYAVYDNWHRWEEQAAHASWDRTRLVCVSILQPYSKKSLTPRDVMTFPWEQETEETAATETRQESSAEIQARYTEAKRRRGLK